MTIIDINNIHKHYAATPVLTAITLQVAAGELLALLGPSGSGKSTLLKLIAGLERPDSGDICFDGTSVLALPAERREAVLMFQSAYLFPFLTVAENIAFGLRARRTPQAKIRAEVQRMLELVELPGIEKRYPHQLSGGQQQRVALARALVIQPRVLLLDEPLSNLDPAIRATLQSVIRRIQREFKITTLLVTHDLSEAIGLSDRTAILLDGRIVACAAPEQLFQRPPNRTAAEFVGVGAIISGTLAGDQLQTAHGPLTVAVRSPAARPLTCAIRPEHLYLSTAAQPNSLPVQVHERIFRGEYVEYTLAAGADQWRAKVFQETERYVPGATVFAVLPPEHLFELAGPPHE